MIKQKIDGYWNYFKENKENTRIKIYFNDDKTLYIENTGGNSFELVYRNNSILIEVIQRYDFKEVDFIINNNISILFNNKEYTIKSIEIN